VACGAAFVPSRLPLSADVGNCRRMNSLTAELEGADTSFVPRCGVAEVLVATLRRGMYAQAYDQGSSGYPVAQRMHGRGNFPDLTSGLIQARPYGPLGCWYAVELPLFVIGSMQNVLCDNVLCELAWCGFISRGRG
jgi:hypothetical protein